MVLNAILNGTDYAVTGKPPFFPFPGGSFANGGAMRISPLAIAYRNASSEELRAACTEAIRSSHVHEEAIDGAVVQATSVRRALMTENVQDFDPIQLLDELISVVKTKAMRDRLLDVKREFQQVIIQKENEKSGASGENQQELVELDNDFAIDIAALKRLVPNTRPGSGLGFQIASIDALPCVLWCVIRYAVDRPEQVLSRAISLGGDTDTVASMVGAIVGALHGLPCSEGASGGACCWIAPHLIDGLENGERGRDYALQLAQRLCELDETKIIMAN